MKKIKIPNNDTPPLCGCQCGQHVERSKLTGNWNKYVHGHNSRSNNAGGQFKQGNKIGKGRPQGSRNKVSIAAMALLKDEEHALSRRAIELAINGNVQMLQFTLSRLLPPPPKDSPVNLADMPTCNDVESTATLSSYILAKLSSGQITPVQAHLVSGVIEKHIRCLQLTDVEARLEAIEDRLEKVG